MDNEQVSKEGIHEYWEAHAKETRIEWIAYVCHQANKAWCESQLDTSQKDWGEAEQWQKDSAIKGVKFRLEHPECGVHAQHESWMEEKLSQGWVWGKVKDTEKKTHPCLVTFDYLPEHEQKKDKLFCAIVDALK